MPPLIDRVVARLGAAPLVAGRPGMGWLLIEVVPALLWVQVAGAVTLESFYLIRALRLGGADERQLAWLPLVGFGAVALAPAIAWWRERAHDRRGGDHADGARRFAIRSALTGRVLWLGVVLAPLAAGALGAGPGAGFAGALACICAAQVALFASMGAFASWTQALIPPELRGRFIAWRNVACALGASAATFALSLLLPRGAPPETELAWLRGVLLVVTLGCIASTAWLARSPRAPAAPAGAAPRGPFALDGRGGFVAFAAWNMAHIAASACSQPYLPVVIAGAGIDAADYALWQSVGALPLQLAATVAAGIVLRRAGSGRLLLAAHLALILGEAAFLALDPGNRAWLFPMAMALAGAARGVAMVAVIGRLWDVVPYADTRHASAFHAAGGVAGALAGFGLLTGFHMLPTGGGSGGAAWSAVAAGVLIRGIATGLLLKAFVKR